MDKTTLDIVWMIICAGLVFLMQAGFTCLESGLTRSKNSINVGIKNIADFGLSACLFWAFGFGLMFGATWNNWFGVSGFFFDTTDPMAAAFFLYQLMFCGTAVTIVSGAIAERTRFSCYLFVVVLLSGLIYPVFGHWAWSGRVPGDSAWLHDIGFVDFAGSTVVHSVGGWVALVAVVLVGPREGRFVAGRPAHRFQGHNLPVAVLGTLLLWVGWLGFNGGGAYEASPQIAAIIVRTVLAGAAGLVTALLFRWSLTGFADVRATINGSLAGLVAITASCHAVNSSAAILIGAIGSLAMLAVDWLLERLEIDDAVSAIAVHAGAGVWGTLAVAFFADPIVLNNGLTWPQQLGVQAVGVATCFLWTAGAASIVLFTMNRVIRLRVTQQQERDGLNVSEHGTTTELFELFKVMERQAESGDVRDRAPVEPFTEVGQIAALYNRVLDAVQHAEERFRAAVHCAPNAVMIVDDSGQIVLANPQCERLFGYNQSQLVGKQVESLMPERFRKGHPKHIAEYFASPERRVLGGELEFLGLTSDGMEVPIEIGLSPILTEAGNLVLSSIIDISEQKKKEDRLRDSEERFKTLVEHAVEAILLLDVDSGRFADANKHALQLFEVSREQFLQMHPVDLSPPNQPGGRTSEDVAQEKIGIALSEGVAVFDWMHRTATGRDISCEVRLVRLPGEERRQIRASVIDISERKELEETLRHARNAAEEASRAKSEFLAHMSHEIRTPMNGVIGMLELLRNTGLNERQTEYSLLAMQSAESLLRLLNDILDLSKIEAGKLDIESTSFSLREVLDATLKPNVMKADEKGLELALHVHTDVPDAVVGDPWRLRQVLANLVSNAIKFTSSGEVVIAVSNDTLSETSAHLHFSVRDTGDGIPAEIQQKIFESFRQADSSMTRRYGGTGLGLPISKQLVEMMGGTMGLDSQTGEGSTFSFTVRFDLPDEVAPPQHAPISLQARPILVVDDNQINRMIFSELLSWWGMAPITTNSAAEAWDELTRAAQTGAPYSVAILDAAMPDEDGLSLAARIRADDSLKEMALLLISSTYASDYQTVCDELDVNCDVRKPVKQADLFDVLLRELAPESKPPASEPKIEAGMAQKTAKILLAEDGVINQKVAVGLLQVKNHNVVIAENGREAVEAVQRETFDLILMDVHMPEMDGVEATRRIRELEQATGRRTPIIAMTADALSGEREKLLDAGMDEYLSKPVNPTALYETIDRVLEAKD